MKRNVILMILLFLFNLLWLYGVSYANRLITANDWLIVIGEKEVIDNNEELPPVVEEIVEYDGEDFSVIGKKIEKYLKDTKLEGYGEYIAKYSVSKAVNPYLIGAIIMINSNCEIQCNAIVESCNNVGDLTGSSGGCFGGTYKKYSTLEDGIEDLVNYVLEKFYANDLKSPSAFYTLYNKNSAWSYRVTKYMEKLKKTKIS